jgi:hypothetical protein
MRTPLWVLVLCVVAVTLVGCGRGNQRKNDPGPPLEKVPGGPPPMKPPGEGDTAPPGPTKTKGR